MRNISLPSWVYGSLLPRLVLPGLVAWMVLFLHGIPCEAQSHPPSQVQRIPIYDARPPKKAGFGASLQKGFQGVAQVFKPKIPLKFTDDPVKLSTKSRPTANFHVAVARLYEQSDQFDLAADQYERALQLSSDDLAALLGYARLEERLIIPDKAASLYHRAAAAHPDEPAVFNNMGLFYTGRKMLDDSVAAFERAIELAPKNSKYRNNLAQVLVEQGRNADAFQELRSVHSRAVAYYNLGYLLEQHGKPKFAAHHYAMALRYDPKFAHAKQGFARVEYSLADLPPLGETSKSNSQKSGNPAHSPAVPLLPPNAGRGVVRAASYHEVEQLKPPQREPSRPLSLRRLPVPRDQTPDAPMPPELSSFGQPLLGRPNAN